MVLRGRCARRVIEEGWSTNVGEVAKVGMARGAYTRTAKCVGAMGPPVTWPFWRGMPEGGRMGRERRSPEGKATSLRVGAYDPSTWQCWVQHPLLATLVAP